MPGRTGVARRDWRRWLWADCRLLDDGGVLVVLVDPAGDGSGDAARNGPDGADAGDHAADNSACDTTGDGAADLFTVTVALMDDGRSVRDGDFFGHGEDPLVGRQQGRDVVANDDDGEAHHDERWPAAPLQVHANLGRLLAVGGWRTEKSDL